MLLRDVNGKPWAGGRDVRPMRQVIADDPETAVREAFTDPPSSLNVYDAWVVALAEPYEPVSVLIDVDQPKWGKARAAIQSHRPLAEGGQA